MRAALELQPCCWQRAGIGVYTYEVARRLKDGDGLEFCGNVFNFAGRADISGPLEGISMPVRECRALSYGVYRRIWHMLPLSYNKLFPAGADLTLFFNFIVPPGISGHVITVIHDMTHVRYPETVSKTNLRRILRDLDYSVERSDHIVTVSEFSKREMMELLHIPEGKISVVYSAPSISGATADFSDTAQKYQIKGPYLLYVGTIEPRKNLTRLLKAFQLLKREQGIPHQLLLAGGSGWNNREIYQTAKELSCAADVVFTGFVSAAEKNALYQHAAAFVFPSLYEGFGVPPLEAMHFDCPVVCAKAASLPEIAGDAACLVDPLDKSSIAEGIWSVLSSRDHAATLIERGKQQRKKYTWEASAAQLTQICRKYAAG